MTITRAEVLTTLRRLGYPVSCGDLAQIMEATSSATSKALTGLFATDKINRVTVSGNAKFAYSVKVRA